MLNTPSLFVRKRLLTIASYHRLNNKITTSVERYRKERCVQLIYNVFVVYTETVKS